jgi:hypothetical protein
VLQVFIPLPRHDLERRYDCKLSHCNSLPCEAYRLAFALAFRNRAATLPLAIVNPRLNVQILLWWATIVPTEFFRALTARFALSARVACEG